MELQVGSSTIAWRLQQIPQADGPDSAGGAPAAERASQHTYGSDSRQDVACKWPWPKEGDDWSWNGASQWPWSWSEGWGEARAPCAEEHYEGNDSGADGDGEDGHSA